MNWTGPTKNSRLSYWKYFLISKSPSLKSEPSKPNNAPWVIITSNRTRDIHDALKRRCLYHWIEYPSVEKEFQIILSRIPKIDHTLAGKIARFMATLRSQDFQKKPGISESLDWAWALIHLHKPALDEQTVEETLGCILKYQEDQRFFREKVLGDEGRRKAFFGTDAGTMG